MNKKNEGLYQKFNVSRTDGSSVVGGKHEGCDYFVLDLTHDKFAIPAIRAYADACQSEYPALASDLKKKCPECKGSGFVRSLGRDNDEVITDCQTCNPPAPATADKPSDGDLASVKDRFSKDHNFGWGRGAALLQVLTELQALRNLNRRVLQWIDSNDTASDFASSNQLGLLLNKIRGIIATAVVTADKPDERTRMLTEGSNNWLRAIKHLNRLATWAQQDPTGPVEAKGVQAWVLNEIRQALGGKDEGSDWQPAIPADVQAVVDALPKTVDGVPIVPDMMVYIVVGSHVDERRVVAPYGKQALLYRQPAMHGACEGDVHTLAKNCYSTRQRALDALTGGRE